MKYYRVNPMGDDQDKKLAFIDNAPEGMGLASYRMAFGERAGEDYPTEASIYLQPKSLGIKLCSLIGNVEGYLIVCTAVKEIIAQHCGGIDIEYLSFKLYNHKKRVHSDDYWIVNPIGCLDCLNRQASEIEYLDESQDEIVEIDTCVLDPKKLQSAPALFRIPEELDAYFISETLADDLQRHDFTNLYLTEIPQQVKDQ